MDIIVRPPPRKMVLLNADLAGVEFRIEMMLAAGTPEFFGTDVAKDCVRLATAHPTEFDPHRFSAGTILDKSEADVKDTDDEPERYLGKRTMHGFCRGMGASKLADLMLVDGHVVTVETTQRYLAKLAARLPAIPQGFFLDVQRQAMRFRALGTTWGGIYRCDFQRLEEPLYGKMYSYQPVRETVDLINQCGFLPLRNAIALRRLTPRADRPTPRVHVHGHDSLAISVHPEDAWVVASFLEKTLAQAVRYYRAGPLQVPVSYGIGHTWKATKEWKKLPSRDEMREVAWACATAEGAR